MSLERSTRVEVMGSEWVWHFYSPARKDGRPKPPLDTYKLSFHRGFHCLLFCPGAENDFSVELTDCPIIFQYSFRVFTCRASSHLISAIILAISRLLQKTKIKVAVVHFNFGT